MGPIAQFKEDAKLAWSTFAATETISGSVAPQLVRFAGIADGTSVLDVGCGTGVVALTAARVGARVTGLDLTPELLQHAKENARTMRVDIDWHEGDVEALPFDDGRFEIVVSQFGHMFAPRPNVALREMLRVLRPGGVIAFSTWPPDVFTGKMFALVAGYAPPPPAGVASPLQWGDPTVVRERLGSAVKDICFDRGTMRMQILSPQHHREFMERHIGPVNKLVRALEASDKQRLAEFRREFEELSSVYFEDNHVRQDFLMTRAVKV
ncbi:class I SAM-dependent methyltransferase [Pendulispora rubella]|uniref:Class I SAM-dependent methyltransferase n=2 Tax=Pendulispora rubella TaxID=2741070 RepID=A0ABZ2L783_9BACT